MDPHVDSLRQRFMPAQGQSFLEPEFDKIAEAHASECKNTIQLTAQEKSGIENR